MVFSFRRSIVPVAASLLLALASIDSTLAFSASHTNLAATATRPTYTRLFSTTEEPAAAAVVEEVADDVAPGYEPPEDVIIMIKPPAMARLRELKGKRDADPKGDCDPSIPMVLRMGVRNGGCSGLSYVMDFSAVEDIQEDDEVDDYAAEGVQCVVDSKSLLYLYGLELDYSDELIGGGFKFFNPNAEDSCGCGSSFGV